MEYYNEAGTKVRFIELHAVLPNQRAPYLSTVKTNLSLLSKNFNSKGFKIEVMAQFY